MSDFGIDAYAFDEVDTAGGPHPLEIARDLIATGKPRSALEVLSLHHDQLAGEPEYLMLCAEAWLDDGDELRAQQALLGAARLDPEDPRPIRWLGELVAERGEHERAERLLAKARALEVLANGPEEPLDPTGAEAGDDLIAFAERQQRRQQAGWTARQVWIGSVALAAIASIIAAIAHIAGPRAGVFADAQTPPVTASAGQEPPPPAGPQAVIPDLVSEASEGPEPHGEPLVETDRVSPSPITQVVVAEKPEPEPPPAIASPPPVTSVPRVRRVAAPPRISEASASPQSERKQESNDTVSQVDLASTDPKQLTARGDALQARGNPAAAAGYYRRALEIDPDYAPALVGMGDSLLRAKMYADAMRNATRALQLARGVDARPGLEATAIYQLGRVHFERDERDVARQLFRQSISLGGTPAEAWFYLGEALSSDNSPAAREAYQEYLELVPTGNLANRARRAIQ
ncbi:MAG: tetratricopeptide repeat protein [Polyangiales bacterium]